MNAKVAWTWSVKLGSGRDMSFIHNDDVKFLKSVYEGLRSGPPYVYHCGIVSIKPTQYLNPSALPSVTKSPIHSLSFLPSISIIPLQSRMSSMVSTKSPPASWWMSSNHGIVFRLMGGVSYFTAYFDVNIFVGKFTEKLLQ